MEIRVLGSECARCLKLDFLVRQVLDELRARVKLEWVTNEGVIEYLLAGESPPGLMIDGELVCAGRVPAKAEIVSWITTALTR